jgi:hypothetical protein
VSFLASFFDIFPTLIITINNRLNKHCTPYDLNQYKKPQSPPLFSRNSTQKTTSLFLKPQMRKAQKYSFFFGKHGSISLKRRFINYNKIEGPWAQLKKKVIAGIKCVPSLCAD